MTPCTPRQDRPRHSEVPIASGLEGPTGGKNMSEKTKRKPYVPPTEVDYRARLIHSIRSKQYEAYAISRIVHRLDDPEIELVTQQAVRLRDRSLALLDLYLPQFDIGVEVDELHHLAPRNAESDRVREQKILDVVDLDITRLAVGDAADRLAFQAAIDAFVDDIRARKVVAIERGSFVPFVYGNRHDPEHWIGKGQLSTGDDIKMPRTHFVTALFGANHRGFQSAGYWIGEDLMLWMPVLRQEHVAARADWENVLSDSEDTITERQLPGSSGGTHDYSGYRRVVFARFRDPVLADTYYRFLGVYELVEQTTARAEFRRIATTISLPSGEPVWSG